MHSRNGDVIDHIDPSNSDLVCGLDTKANKMVLDWTTNNRKSNRFVPYRVDCRIAVHKEYGDWGFFLINEEWCLCKFGGPEWWAEASRLGFGPTKAGKKTAELGIGVHAPGVRSAAGKKGGARTRDSGKLQKISKLGGAVQGPRNVGMAWYHCYREGSLKRKRSKTILPEPWIKGRGKMNQDKR